MFMHPPREQADAAILYTFACFEAFLGNGNGGEWIGSAMHCRWIRSISLCLLAFAFSLAIIIILIIIGGGGRVEQ